MFGLLKIPATIIDFFDPAVSHAEIAGSVCLALFLAFVPWNGIMALVLFLFFFILKFNRVAAAVSLPLFKFVYMAGAYSLADRLGGFLLIDAAWLKGFWTWLVNLPVIALLDVNNTLVAGGIALSALLCVPVFFLSKAASARVRPRVSKRIFNSKFGKWADRIRKANKISSTVDTVV